MSGTDQVPGYALELPSVEMILASLGRYLDDDEIPAVWSKACAQAGMDVNGRPTGTDELLQLVDALEQCGDLAAVCAKGLRIRIMSWAILSRSASVTAQVGI